MSTIKTTAAALAATTVATTAALSAALAGAGAASAAPTTADQTFVTMNQQSNLAEIALGKLGQQRGGDAATKALADKTLSDHQKASALLSAATKKAGGTMPAAPNAMQQMVATQLTSTTTTPAASFDLKYAQAEVAGHQQALAGARKELSTTKNAALKSYDQTYIPLATMHLQMAQAEVKKLGGNPNSVTAGRGTAAATNGGNEAIADAGLGAGAILVLGGLGLALRRRRVIRTR